MMVGSSWCRRPLMVLLILCVLQPMLQLPVSRGCFPEERAALMEIRASLVRANSTSPPPPWGKAGNDDCCTWEGVTCSDATGRVSHLNLSKVHVAPGHGHLRDRTFNLDTTVFAAFSELQVLDISSNRPMDLLSFDGLKNLSNLQKLDLANNGISGNLPSFLFSLPHIEVLNLSRNMFEGPIPISSSSNLSLSLKSLRLSQNNFSGKFSLFWLNNLTHLKKLDLSRNANLGVTVNIPGWVPRFQLKHLSLSGCDLDKDIIAKPKFLRTQHHLEDLDLSSNNLSGGMPNWLFTKGSTLVRLILRNNTLTGSLGPIWYPQTSLEIIDISKNNIVGQLPANISSMFPNLIDLVVSNNNLSGEIPMSLCHMNRTKYLSVLNNKFSGEMPACMFTGLPNLEILSVSNNSLTGSLDSIWYTQTSLQYINISMNHIVGQLPSNISSVFPSLSIIDVSKNNISGEIPMSLCHIKKIKYLNLHNNRFSGEIPACVFTDLPNLYSLIVSNNHLGGPIFGGRNNLSPSLVKMYLGGNKFEGALPRNLSAGELVVMDLHDNRLTGELDTFSWNITLPHLLLLYVHDNYMTGEIHLQICALPSINYLDLSNNHFSGRIRGCDRTSLLSFNVSMNSLSGDVSWEQFNTSTLFNLDFRHNMLTGNLNWVRHLHRIRVLSLGHNKFHGHIPPSLCKLRYLRIIDLSHNKLSGPVPSCLGGISFRDSPDTPPFWVKLKQPTLNTAGSFTFDTKGMQLTYGPTNDQMSGINLAGNSLSGKIPRELGELCYVKSLNLSRNDLVGPILASLANLSEVESLDLSHNKLNGAIPPELTRLQSLEVFSVAYNNLSGCVPSTGQFNTFGTDSYEGNNLLKMECTSSSGGLEPVPRDEMVVDVGPYMAAAASFVLAFWATVAFSFCQSTERRMVLKM